jgi:hypothetical protein
VTARRDRLERVERLLKLAKQVSAELRAGEPARLPLDLAAGAALFLTCAEDLAGLAHRELLALEAARDPEEQRPRAP